MQTTRLCSLGRVEHRPHVLALPAAIAERGDRRRGVPPQPVGEAGSLQARATTRAPLRGPISRLVELDQRVERGRVDQAFLGQDRLQRHHPRRHRDRDGCHGPVRIVVIVIVRHPAPLSGRLPIALPRHRPI